MAAGPCLGACADAWRRRSRARRYAEWYDAFALVDGDGAGVTADDDKKISLGELEAGVEALAHMDYVALKGKTAADAEAMFVAMDADGKGEVLLAEWCDYIKAQEIAAGQAGAKKKGTSFYSGL